MNAYRSEPLGLAFRAPGPEWKKEVSVQGEALTVSFSDGKNTVYLTMWELRAPLTPEGYRETTLAHHKKENKGSELWRGARVIGGRPAAAIRLRDAKWLSDSSYFERDGVFYTLIVYVPLAGAKALAGLTKAFLSGLEWSVPRPSRKKPGPAGSWKKEKGHVVTVVRGKGEDAAFRYLEAIPGAALANEGLPVILVVEKDFGEAARAFLRKFRPEKLREGANRWKPGGTVLVCERDLKSAVPAAALAAKLKVPLLVAGPDLEKRLARLKPKRILRAAEMESGPASYVALCNVAEGFECVFAAALAAAHGGKVVVIDKPVRWQEGVLDAAGAGAIGGIKVSAPVIGKLRLTEKYEAPRFGHPRIELDGRWEEPPIGSTVRVGGKRYMFSARFAQPVGAMITSHGGDGSVLLLEPDPNEIREELSASLAGTESLAIVGTPERIPFFYSECKSYFDGYALNQENASDEPYAPGLAVGRLLPEGLETGSAVIATTIAYPQLTGAWRDRAAVIQPGFAKKEVESGYQWVMPEAEALLRGVSADMKEAGIACDGFFRDKVEASAAVASLAKAGWICFHNHADQREWGIHPESKIVPRWKSRVLSEPPAGTRELPELEGAPIVYCGGCGSAGIDVGIPFGETHPGRFFELGAVAYLGNTRTASIGAEYAVKLFFDRLLFSGASLGEAFRDGRRFLRHLLEMRHVDPHFEDWLQDPIMYDVLWEQYYNMNLFGDPGLRPRRAGKAGVSVSLKGRTLTVERKAPERVDAVQFMPMFAKGSPRDTCLRTGAGLTYCDLPMNFMDRENGLAPLRTPPKTPPGAWVDVPLPKGARGVAVRLKSGPKWADRGFSVEPGPRLRMFVPLTYATLEAGEGEAARKVVFDVSYERSGTRRQARVLDRPRWKEKGTVASGIVSPAAKPVSDKMEARRYDLIKEGLRMLEMTITCEPSRDFRETRFHAVWRKGKGVSVDAVGLPPQWAGWKKSILGGIRAFVERTILGSGESFSSYHVDVLKGDGKETVLEYRPAASREGAELIRRYVTADHLLRKESRRRFGVWFSTEYEWRDVGRGFVVSKLKLSDVGMATAEIGYEYKKVNGFHLLARMTSATPGYMPPSIYRIEYRRAVGGRGT